MTITAPVSPDVAAPGRAEARPSLIGMSRAELGSALAAIGVPASQVRMRTAQLWHWLYVRGATDFADMTNVSKGLRAELAEAYTIGRPEIVSEQISEDGTRKWLLRFPPRGAGRPVEVETVYIPEEGRGTLCLSSQVGCTLSCSFCHTGTQTLVRNLSAEEIVGQVLLARDRLGDYPAVAAPRTSPPPERGRWPGEAGSEGVDQETPPQPLPFQGREGGAAPVAPSTGRLVSNIVMMGMGEPLYNYDNVRQALQIVADGDGIALSKRRITLSTSGVVPMIARAGEEIGVLLAISLHAVTDELRDVLVPLNKKYPIAELMAACPCLSGAFQCAAHHLRICDAEGHQRYACRGAGAGQAACRHPGQDQPDPVQSVAGLGLRVLRLGDDRALRRHRQPGRLCLAGAHAARARYPGRLRPAQERERAPQDPRAHGAGSDDRGVGVTRLAELLRLLFLVPLGFIAAVVAAAGTLLAGWYGHEPGVFTDVGATGFVIGIGVFAVLRIGALAFIPAFVVAVLAELFRWRSVFLYLAVGGALGGLAGQLPVMGWEADGRSDTLLLLAAGFVGGFVYWSIAGRFSGIGRASEPPPPAETPTSPE